MRVKAIYDKGLSVIEEASGSRRRVPRRDFGRKIGVLVKGHYHLSTSLQIGEGGMMIYSKDALIVDQRVVVSFRFPFSKPRVVTAIVRYVLPAKKGQKANYGLEFINLEFDVRREIRNYVALQTQKEKVI